MGEAARVPQQIRQPSTPDSDAAILDGSTGLGARQLFSTAVTGLERHDQTLTKDVLQVPARPYAGRR